MKSDARQWRDRFGTHLGSERRLSPHTAANYLREVDALIDWCEANSVKTWKLLDTQHLRLFAARSHAGGLSPRSVQRRLSAVRTFLRFLQRERVITQNPAADVRAPKAMRRLPETLDVDQMSRLLDIRGDDPLALRDRAIMELFYSSGLRLAELIALDLGAIDFADRTVRVTGKGNKSRILPVGRKAVDALQAWLKVRGDHAGAGETALFTGRGGRRVGHPAHGGHRAAAFAHGLAAGDALQCGRGRRLAADRAAPPTRDHHRLAHGAL